ncbi:MAG: hypothetical protein A2075_13295 [Geobacteraceae bacterium GWC2_58_44]|nr:MAG: hypothetical protein A2075_13295 [Geobacteraceae bacterium GWC2_58_44]HBG08226.1 hypothetical protein [Geobacter sp.]
MGALKPADAGCAGCAGCAPYRVSGATFTLLLTLLLFLPGPAGAADWQWMAPQRVQSLVREGSGLWLVDIRGSASFERSHAEGSLHIPKQSLAAKRFAQQKILVLVDDSLGLQAARDAAALLVGNGQEKVYLLEGGLPAWKGEGLPLAGQGRGAQFGSVRADELEWAQENRVPLRILDLRGKEEQASGSVRNARRVAGDDLQQRLARAADLAVRKDSLSAQLEGAATTILVFPSDTDPLALLERNARLFPGDVRYLEGGVAAWAARPGKRVQTIGGCPTCPGGVPERKQQ